MPRTGFHLMESLLFLSIAFIILGPLTIFLFSEARKNYLRLSDPELGRNEKLLIILKIILTALPATWFVCWFFSILYRMFT